jgi:carboxyl-terminal processing protease
MIEFDRETKRLMVMSPLIDTPAARAGVKAGDIILEIEGRSTAEMSFRDAVELIRGKPGDPVRLKILHPGDEQPVDLSIQRAIIPIESVLGDVRRPDGRWDFRLESEPRITYIRLVTFGENTVEELKKVLEGRKLESLVLDLRDNAGGLLSAAVETCDLFLDEGTVVTIRGREGEVRQSYLASAKSLVPKDVPVTVLVNRYSASASEIVAACLQDHGRAKIVGHRTWGKGTVQNIIDLEGGEAALKLTTASYWRPSGKNIHRVKDAGQDDDWGVRPDKGFEVELTDEQADKIRTQRRQRDGLRSPQNASQTSEGKPAAKDGDEAVEDLQLRRAVEYLQGEMGVPAKHAAA